MRNGLALGGLLMILACNRGQPAPSGQSPTPPVGKVGLHDHTPHHGGVVAMAGMIHLEAVATPDGRVRIYPSDLWRRPLPLDGLIGSVVLDLPGVKRSLSLAPAGDALEADGPPLTRREVNVHVTLTVTRDREPVEMNFLLPLARDAPGAAGVPAAGCVPPSEQPDRTGRLPRCILDFARPISAISTTPDSAIVLIAAVDIGVTAWRLPRVELAVGFAAPPPFAMPVDEPPHPESPKPVAMRPDGRELLVALEGRLLRYAVATGKVVKELPGPGGVVRAVAWSPDGTRLLVSAFYDDSAHLLNADDGRQIGRFRVTREAAAVAFAPDGQLIAVGSQMGSIALFDPRSETPLGSISGSGTSIDILGFAGARLVAGGSDGILRVWDTARGVALYQEPSGRPFTSLAIAPGGRLVASGGLDGTLRIHDVMQEKAVDTLQLHTQQIAGLAWAAGELVSGDVRGRVAFWDLSSLMTTAELPNQRSNVTDQP